MKTFVTSVLLFVCSLSYGQEGIPGYAAYAPGSTAMVPVMGQNGPVVNQTVVAQPSPPAQNVPAEWLHNGYREQFTRTDTHDVYPFRDWNYPGYAQQGVAVAQPAVQAVQVYQNDAPQWQYGGTSQYGAYGACPSTCTSVCPTQGYACPTQCGGYSGSGCCGRSWYRPSWHWNGYAWQWY